MGVCNYGRERADPNGVLHAGNLRARAATLSELVTFYRMPHHPAPAKRPAVQLERSPLVTLSTTAGHSVDQVWPRGVAHNSFGDARIEQELHRVYDLGMIHVCLPARVMTAFTPN